MPQETENAQIDQEKQDQVLQREGLEEELMEQDRSEDGAEIAGVDTTEEDR